MFISSKIRIAWEDKRELRKQCKKEVPERNISRKCGCCVEELAKWYNTQGGCVQRYLRFSSDYRSTWELF
jgi:hypothetical protein